MPTHQIANQSNVLVHNEIKRRDMTISFNSLHKQRISYRLCFVYIKYDVKKVTIHVLLAYNRESTTSTVCSWCGGYGDVVPLDANTVASRAGLMVDGV